MRQVGGPLSLYICVFITCLCCKGSLSCSSTKCRMYGWSSQRAPLLSLCLQTRVSDGGPLTTCQVLWSQSPRWNGWWCCFIMVMITTSYRFAQSEHQRTNINYGYIAWCSMIGRQTDGVIFTRKTCDPSESEWKLADLALFCILISVISAHFQFTHLWEDALEMSSSEF